VDKTDTKKVTVYLTDSVCDPSAVSIFSKGLNFTQKWTAYLSDSVPDPSAVSMLCKVLNFTQIIDPNSNLNEAISSVDEAIHHHPNDTVEKIHQGLATP
jgi:hypothetical protein